MERQIRPPRALLLKPGAAPALALLMQEGRVPMPNHDAARQRERRETFGFAMLLAAMLVSVLATLSVLPAAKDAQRAMTTHAAAQAAAKSASQTHADGALRRAIGAAPRHSPQGRAKITLAPAQMMQETPSELVFDDESFRRHSPPYRAALRSVLAKISEAQADSSFAPAAHESSAPRSRPRLPRLSIPGAQGVIAVEVLARPQKHSPERRPKLSVAAHSVASAPLMRVQEYWRAKGDLQIPAQLTTGSLGRRVLAGYEVPIPRRAVRNFAAKSPGQKAKARCWNRIWRCDPVRTAASSPRRKPRAR